MLDYKKTEDMERMKAEAVKRLKWLKIPELDEAFAKGIVMVSDGTNGDVKLIKSICFCLSLRHSSLFH